MHIKDRVFIVTGGGSGLGAATARLLAAGGGKIVVADVNAEAGEAVRRELGDGARFVRADIVQEADGKTVVAEAESAFGGLHGLANCAGIGVAERVLGREAPHRLDAFARVIGVNLIGTFNMIRLAAAAMARGAPDEGGERGVIVNTASIAAFDGQIGQAAYAASKAGVAGLTLPVARELARVGIRVVTIAPGLFETPMLASLPADVQKALGDSVPFPQRLGQPQEFAALVKHVVENPMLNGEVIRLDGALRMAPR